MLSKTTYWVILISGLGIFIGIDFLLIIPVVYDIGIDLLADAIFAIFTIIFLSWLIDYREVSRWKAVKDEVYKDIQSSLSTIFNEILNLIKNGFLIKSDLLKIVDAETRKNAAFQELYKLKEAKVIELEPILLKAFLNEKESLEPFMVARQELFNVEVKYSKFLSPQVVLSLKKVQRSVELLKHSSDLWRMFSKFRKLTKTKPVERIPSNKGLVTKMVVESVKIFVGEIYRLHRMGIEFYYL